MSESVKISMGNKKPTERTCVVCGKKFFAKGNQKCCSFLCSDSQKNLRRKGRKKLESVLNKIRD